MAHYTYASRRKIEIIRQIAEGGFSVVYSAKDCVDSLRNTNDNLITTASLGGRRSFALKQIICHDEGVTRKCREEAALHRTFHHPNLMPILACKFDRNATYGEFNGMICYMLFPLYESSLRDQINKRNLLSTSTSLEPIHPWSEREIIEVSIDFTSLSDIMIEIDILSFLFASYQRSLLALWMESKLCTIKDMHIEMSNLRMSCWIIGTSRF